MLPLNLISSKVLFSYSLWNIDVKFACCQKITESPSLSLAHKQKKPSLTIWVDNFALVYIICHAIFIDVEKCSWILFPLLVSWLVLFFRAKRITESWVSFHQIYGGSISSLAPHNNRQYATVRSKLHFHSVIPLAL